MLWSLWRIDNLCIGLELFDIFLCELGFLLLLEGLYYLVFGLLESLCAGLAPVGNLYNVVSESCFHKIAYLAKARDVYEVQMVLTGPEVASLHAALGAVITYYEFTKAVENDPQFTNQKLSKSSGHTHGFISRGERHSGPLRLRKDSHN